VQKHPAFSTNHSADTGKAKHNCNQKQKNIQENYEHTHEHQQWNCLIFPRQTTVIAIPCQIQGLGAVYSISELDWTSLISIEQGMWIDSAELVVQAAFYSQPYCEFNIRQWSNCIKRLKFTESDFRLTPNAHLNPVDCHFCGWMQKRILDVAELHQWLTDMLVSRIGLDWAVFYVPINTV